MFPFTQYWIRLPVWQLLRVLCKPLHTTVPGRVQAVVIMRLKRNHMTIREASVGMLRVFFGADAIVGNHGGIGLGLGWSNIFLYLWTSAAKCYS